MKGLTFSRELLMTLAVVCSAAFSSCEMIFPEGRNGEIMLRFSERASSATRGDVGSLDGGAAIPDTNDFILTVMDSKKDIVYEGAYGLSPEGLQVSPGEYTVKVVSTAFDHPDFNTPQYGDIQTVDVKSGCRSYVELLCHQTNSGMKLNIAEDFLTVFPNGAFFLKSDDGKLMYSFTEKRIAYFNPGEVTLMLSDGAEDRDLFVRRLESREILSVNISAPTSASSSIPVSIQLDTTRYWTSEDFHIGNDDGVPFPDTDVYTIQQAKNDIGAKDIWVRGYIVGGDLSSSKVSFSGPFSSRTNIAIAARASVSEKSSCLSVQLQKGNIRDALNLVDNPDILGREVLLKGDIVQAYYGIPGIQNITEYRFR